MLSIGAVQPRKKPVLREDPSSASGSTSSSEGEGMSDSSRNEEVREAVDEIAKYFPRRLKVVPGSEVEGVGGGDGDSVSVPKTEANGNTRIETDL